MNNTVKYFLSLLKSINYSDKAELVFKSFAVTQDGHRLWDIDDLKQSACKNTKNVLIAGIGTLFNCDWFTDDTARRSYAFQNCLCKSKDEQFAVRSVRICDLKSDPACMEMVDSMFMQMMLLSDIGQDIWLGRCMFIEKDSAYVHMTKCDMQI